MILRKFWNISHLNSTMQGNESFGNFIEKFYDDNRTPW